MSQSLAHALATARFYGAKSEPIDRTTVLHSAPATPEGDRLCLVAVEHGGHSDLYQLLLNDASEDVLGSRATALGQALSTGTPAGWGTWHEKRPFPAGLTGRQLDGEQSNTSLIFSDGQRDRVVLKYFRKLEPGVNPEVELLAGMGSTAHVAPLYGWVEAEFQGKTYVTAVAQEFIANSEDGWKRALRWAEAGDSFAEEARLLGAATADVHRALAEGFPAPPLSAEEISAKLLARFRSLTQRVPFLERFTTGVTERYTSLRGSTLAHRVHGDLHLGQVLRTPERYVLIDFEGEPARPLAERRQPDAAVRDVAGLVRSLDYAEHCVDNAPEGWAAAATDALLKGYGVDPEDSFLTAYVLDKALYEVAYEIDNRPDWAHIPRAAVEKALG